MLMNGTSVSYVGTHIFTKGYIEKLRELNNYRINGYLHIIKSLNDEINTVSKKIPLLAQENEMARLLMTVPRIGYYSALLIVSEVGDINSGNENLRLSVLFFIIVMDSGNSRESCAHALSISWLHIIRPIHLCLVYIVGVLIRTQNYIQWFFFRFLIIVILI